MKNKRYLIGMACVTSLVFGMSAFADKPDKTPKPSDKPTKVCELTTITLGDEVESKYCIGLINHEGNTWEYSVREMSGKSLSHWNLGIPSCIKNIRDYSPKKDYEAGIDGSTDFEGIKWDVEESFTEGTFTITLDGDYPETTILAQAKAGPAENARTGEVRGPGCSVIPPEQNACVLEFNGNDPQYSCYEERYENQTSCEAEKDSVLAPGLVVDATWYVGKTCAELRADETIPDNVKLLDTLLPVDLTATGNGVQIGFNRSADSGNLQFKLWKAHVEVIESIDSTDNENGSYTLTDENVIPGNLYCYGVEAIDGSGQNNFNEIKCVIAK